MSRSGPSVPRPRPPEPDDPPAARPVPARVRIASADDLVVTVPHLLGFVPTSSIVLVGCGQGRLVLTVRFDLPEAGDSDPPMGEQQSAGRLAGAIRRAGGDGAYLLLYPDRRPDPDGPGLPYRRLALSLTEGLERAGIVVGAVLCVVPGVEVTRYWAYDCDDPGCCPADGRTVGPLACSDIRAAFVGLGRVVLPDRDALVARLAADDPDDPDVRALDRAVGSALARRQRQCLRRGRSRWARTTVVRLDAALRRCAAAVPVGGLRVREAAELIVVAQYDLPARDTLIAAALHREDLDALLEVLAPVVRRGGNLLGGGIAAMTAALAYLAGDGALTWTAIDRALAVEPGQSMSLLLSRALDSGLAPDTLRDSYRTHPRPGDWDGQPIDLAAG